MTVIKADRAAWQSARTLAGLGELTARWIEGDLASQPGYYGPSDIEDPALVPVLAELNRAGFMTTCSQPGRLGPGYDGKHWEQRAAVEGFIGPVDLVCRVQMAAMRAGLVSIAHDPRSLPRRRFRPGQQVAVTWRDGEEYTWFGAQIPRRCLRSQHTGYGICRRGTVNAICRAWQVTVIDPERGRNDVLWEALGSLERAT